MKEKLYNYKNYLKLGEDIFRVAIADYVGIYLHYNNGDENVPEFLRNSEKHELDNIERFICQGAGVMLTNSCNDNGLSLLRIIAQLELENKTDISSLSDCIRLAVDDTRDEEQAQIIDRVIGSLCDYEKIKDDLGPDFIDSYEIGVRRLSEDSQKVVDLYYGLSEEQAYSIEEIADIIGMDGYEISKIRRYALRALFEYYLYFEMQW